MSDNLTLYNALRTVPETAKKEIQAGKLKGFTDINPMWRIKTLTEQFGPCGIGWKTEIVKQWLETHDGVVCAFCNINLFIKADGEWSDAIPGTGGSQFVSQTRNGPQVSDECWKMAYTDAISVATKMLGVGADVYWNDDSVREDQTKYSGEAERAGTDKLIKRDCQAFAHRLQQVYGNDKAQEHLMRLTGCRTTSEVTYDEYHFALKKIERELALQKSPEDVIGEVETTTIKKIAKALGATTKKQFEETIGFPLDDLPKLKMNDYGALMVELNKKMDDKDHQKAMEAMP